MGTLRICFWVVTVFAVLLGGCVSKDQAFRYYLDHPLPPKSASEVEILNAAPARAYEVIADFQARHETASDMQKHAAEVGADAVIVVQLGGLRSQGDQWAGQDSLGGTYTRIAGTAIVYKGGAK